MISRPNPYSDVDFNLDAGWKRSNVLENSVFAAINACILSYVKISSKTSFSKVGERKGT
jgi:hypothetical protein